MLGDWTWRCPGPVQTSQPDVADSDGWGFLGSSRGGVVQIFGNKSPNGAHSRSLQKTPLGEAFVGTRPLTAPVCPSPLH